MAGASSGTVASSSWCRLNVHLHRALSRKSGPQRECNPWTSGKSGAGNAWPDTAFDRPRINPQGGAGFFAVRLATPLRVARPRVARHLLSIAWISWTPHGPRRFL